MKMYNHFIEGKWTPPDNGGHIDSINPATNQVWTAFARGNQTDANKAVEAAHHAFANGPWSEYSTQQRSEALHQLADILEKRWVELVDAEVSDNGKRITEVKGQFSGLHSWYRYFANKLLEIMPHQFDNQTPGIVNHANYLPFGVVVAITPWNSPLMIAAWKVAPALAAGNTVVIKPSEFASASTLEFARLCSETSIPPGVINVVTGLGYEVGEPLVVHALTRKVSFTGSEFGGQKVAEAAARGIKPVTLELGGKSPQMLFEDADLDNAINGILSGIFLSNGQTCVAGSRLLVDSRIHDRVVDEIVQRASQLKAGCPTSEQTDVAPLANPAHLKKVLSMIANAKSQGANCVSGGDQLFPDNCPNGLFLAPTVFTEVTPEMDLWRQEVFGPVLAITRFETEADAIRLANDSEYGLAAGIWTSDSERANRVASQIWSGTVYINHYRSVDPGSPIGGFKKSGYGKELGPDAIKDYMQVKSIWVGTSPCANPFPSTT
ncbi:MAG: acyl-CoA reductase-like NAD-dependent aldehyde dehydrogenase [Gammaproteobacteria bacterium]|jgi:acyl-CoA reductase-like NAD-dependent aldehyde dehydrogenase